MSISLTPYICENGTCSPFRGSIDPNNPPAGVFRSEAECIKNCSPMVLTPYICENGKCSPFRGSINPANPPAGVFGSQAECVNNCGGAFSFECEGGVCVLKNEPAGSRPGLYSNIKACQDVCLRKNRGHKNKNKLLYISLITLGLVLIIALMAYAYRHNKNMSSSSSV